MLWKSTNLYQLSPLNCLEILCISCGNVGFQFKDKNTGGWHCTIQCTYKMALLAPSISTAQTSRNLSRTKALEN